MNPALPWVAVVFLTIVAIFRKHSGISLRHGALVLLGVTAFLWPALTSRDAVYQADYIFSFYPWDAIGSPIAGSNHDLNDIPLQMIPWSHAVRQSLKSLEIPLWNPFAGGGYPLIGNAQSGAFSPIRLLCLPVPLPYSTAAEGALKLLAAYVFTYLFLRRRYTHASSVAGAVAFALSTFNVNWLLFPLTTVSAFLPAVMLGIDLIAEAPTRGRILFLVFALATLPANGHPETAALVALCGAFYLGFVIVRAPFATGRRTVLAFAASAALAIAITLPITLPFLEALPRSLRYDVIHQTGADFARRDARFLVPFLLPRFFGSSAHGNVWGPGTTEFSSGGAGVLGFVALIAVVAGLGSRVWRRDPWSGLFAALAPVFAWLALGWPVLADLLHVIPPFSMSANARIRLLAGWCLAILAAALVERLRERDADRYVWIGLGAAAVAIIAVFGLNEFPDDAALEFSNLTTAPVLATLLGVAVVLRCTEAQRARWAIPLLIAVSGVEMFVLGHSWSTVAPREMFYPLTPIIEELQARDNPAHGGVHPFRIAGHGAVLYPGSSALYGLEDIRSHDAMANAKVMGLLRAELGYTSWDYNAHLSKFDDPVINLLNVRYVITTPRDPAPGAQFRLVYDRRDGRLYENSFVLPRFYAVDTVVEEPDRSRRIAAMINCPDFAKTAWVESFPASVSSTVRAGLTTARADGRPEVRVRKTSQSSFALDIDAGRPALIVSSEPWYPGWRITGDRARFEPFVVNELFVGFIVPAGHWSLEVRYAPMSFYAGVVISLLTLAGLGGWWIRGRTGAR